MVRAPAKVPVILPEIDRRSGAAHDLVPVAFVFADTTEVKEGNRRYWAPHRYDPLHLSGRSATQRPLVR